MTDKTELPPELEKELEALEDYWDYLDQLEYDAGGGREWDNARACGGA